MTVHLQQSKGCKALNKVCERGYLFREKWNIKGYGVGPRGGASPYKILLSIPLSGFLFTETYHGIMQGLLNHLIPAPFFATNVC